jgi:cysteine synthase A
MQVAEKAPAGSVLLAMLPDTGERYLSTPLFEGIVEGMDDVEIEVMKSTPNFQMQS